MSNSKDLAYIYLKKILSLLLMYCFAYLLYSFQALALCFLHIKLKIGLILTCQSIWGYFMLKGLGILYIVVFIFTFFAVILSIHFIIQIIYTQLHSFKQLLLFNNDYLSAHSYMASTISYLRQFSNGSIWSKKGNLTHTTTWSQSGPGCNGNEGVLYTSQSSTTGSSHPNAV